MCRLFGLHVGTTPVDAEFWLLEAPDSLRDQSRRNADGFGLGTFSPDGHPIVDKSPQPAWRDRDFAVAAHRLRGETFVAHVRHATTGGLTVHNTHPFLQDGRLFAHNGAIGGLPLLDERLDELEVSPLVEGDTDSERMFALITAETRRHGDDVRAGIETAVAWLQTHMEITSLNFVLTEPHRLWAFRSPTMNELFVLERPTGGTDTDVAFTGRGTHLSTHAAALLERPSVVIASEPMDADPRWRPLAPGDLVSVGPDLAVQRSSIPV